MIKEQFMQECPRQRLNQEIDILKQEVFEMTWYYTKLMYKINKDTRNIHKLLYEQEIQWTKKHKKVYKT